MLRRLLPQILLIFALLLAQLGCVTHGISHLLSNPAEHTLANDQHCDLCEVYAQISGAINSSAFTFPPQRLVGISHAKVFNHSPVLSFFPFSARAPPYFA